MSRQDTAAAVARQLENMSEALKMAAGFRLAGRALRDPEISKAIEEGRLADAQRMMLKLSESEDS